MVIDPETIREDFPLLLNRKVTYLDNAATSQRPKQVIEAIAEFYRSLNSNVHRGIYELSQEASEVYEEAHEVVAKFIGSDDWRSVSFTRNSTESLNIIAQSLAEKELREGDEVIVTIMEHNSNVLPWVRLSKLLDLRLKVIALGDDYRLDYDELASEMTSRTKVVAVTHVSNVLGTINDIKRIKSLASEAGAYLIVDGAQSVPHLPVNVRELGVDALAFSGHKMLGPMGIGVLYLRPELAEDLPPPIVGGGMVKETGFREGTLSYEVAEPPWKFEAGTPNVAGAVGLSEAVKYLSKLGMNNVEEFERGLTEYGLKELTTELGDELKVYGPRDLKVKAGIISFNICSANPHLIASLLSSEGIAVRSGYHCAQHLHQFIGASEGSVRASFYIYNTKGDVDKLANSLKKITKEIGKAGVKCTNPPKKSCC